jgi:RND family efflux transporter MFP subunit
VACNSEIGSVSLGLAAPQTMQQQDDTPFRSLRRSPFAALAALLLQVLVVTESGSADIPLETATASYRLAPRERVWDGTIEAVNQATVSSQTSGRVAEIVYDVDDFVEAGAIIMRFTDTEQRAALASARAALQEALARFSEAESEYQRISAMFENGTVARARYDQAQANFNAAEARRESARSGVAAAEEQVEYTIVRAPYAGIVSERHVEVGEMVRPGEPLMSGLSLESLRVSVDVPQSMIEPIRQIGKARVYVGAEVFDGEDLTFFPVADPAANTFRVRVDLPEGAVTLYPGMFVKVGFIVGETERLLVPENALVHRSELTAVYVVAGEQILLRQVRTGRHYGDQVEVLAGLADGERVALDPVRAVLYLKERRAH